jgi:Putative auto-transporter adhesin, head GIN domain
MKSILLLGAVSLVAFSSCNFVGKRVRGNGNIITSSVSVGDFNAVSQKGSIDVIVKSGSAPSVKIEADENIIPYIETRVENGTLIIRTREGYWLKSSHDMKIYVTAPNFTSIKSFGSGDIESESTITTNDPITISTSGSADINVDVHAPEVNASISGSGNINLKGETKKFDAEVMGSGDIKAGDLKTEETKIDIAGSGNADVFASVKLDVSVKGSGDVHYRGNPPSVVSNMKGSGSLEKE